MDRLGQFGPGTNLPGLAGGLRSVAPAPLPDGARFEERTYTNQAGSRGYKLYVPSSYNSKPLPLIIMLHGCTQSPDDFAAGTRMNELAEEYGFWSPILDSHHRRTRRGAGTGSAPEINFATGASPL